MRGEREKPWSFWPDDSGADVPETKVDPEFLREYWQFRVDTKDDPRQVRVRGRLYWLGPDYQSTPRECKGFAGAEFRIRFLDGREVITHDLWTNGVIPLAYREELPDNARFLDPKGYEVNEHGRRLDEESDFRQFDRWLNEQEKRREELSKTPWVPKWKWKKQRGRR